MESRSYFLDPELKVWRSPRHESIAYSDGVEIEERLHHALKQCQDLSSTSDELRQHIVDWPSEYHFSPLRHALLRPFPTSSGDRVLELGCGCGAMTRYLGETGATVIAVEGSLTRARIAAERCRDLPNVSIYCDNLADFSSDLRFDFVTLIGVLEYAPVFLPGKEPIVDCLRVARHFLSVSGQLILAIENQLGLKYFNGCGEDHIGQRYFGVNDLYYGHGPVTFGKQELSSQLMAAGLVSQDFFYPFPDYKLPELILTDQGIRDRELRPAEMLYRSASRDYGGMPQRNFHEYLARDTIARNGLLADMANSFLVSARTAPQTKADPSEVLLACAFCLGRKSSYAVETRFVRTDTGIAVRKHRIGSTSTASGIDAPFTHRPAASASFVAGPLYVRDLQKMLARGGILAEVADWVRPWHDTLKKHSTPSANGDLLPAQWLDAIPSNFVRTATGELKIIDTEWQMSGPAPLLWVFIRGMVNSLAACPLAPALKGWTFRQVIEDSLSRLGLPLPSEEEYRRAAALEDTLMTAVYGSKCAFPPLAEVLAMPVLSFCRVVTMEEERQELNGIIGQLNAKANALGDILAAMHASRSWRVTAPLRKVDLWLKQWIGRK